MSRRPGVVPARFSETAHANENSASDQFILPIYTVHLYYTRIKTLIKTHHNEMRVKYRNYTIITKTNNNIQIFNLLRRIVKQWVWGTSTKVVMHGIWRGNVYRVSRFVKRRWPLANTSVYRLPVCQSATVIINANYIWSHMRPITLLTAAVWPLVMVWLISSDPQKLRNATFRNAPHGYCTATPDVACLWK